MRRPRSSRSRDRSCRTAGSSCTTSSTTRAGSGVGGGRLPPAQDARAVDVVGGAHLQHAVPFAAALELLSWIYEDFGWREEVDAHMVFEGRERAHVLSIPLKEGHAPLDGRLRVGDPFDDESVELLEQRALIGRLLGEIALHRRTCRLLRRGLLGGSLGCDHLELLFAFRRLGASFGHSGLAPDYRTANRDRRTPTCP